MKRTGMYTKLITVNRGGMGGHGYRGNYGKIGLYPYSWRFFLVWSEKYVYTLHSKIYICIYSLYNIKINFKSWVNITFLSFEHSDINDIWIIRENPLLRAENLRVIRIWA